MRVASQENAEEFVLSLGCRPAARSSATGKKMVLAASIREVTMGWRMVSTAAHVQRMEKTEVQKSLG